MKRSFVTILALSFTLLFSFLYIKIFVDDEVVVTSSSSAIVYYLQVGVFSSEDNANKRVLQLEDDDIKAMYYVNQDKYYVITGVSLELQNMDDIKNIVSSKGYGSYQKQIVIHDEVVISAIKEQSYDVLLEVMASK